MESSLLDGSSSILPNAFDIVDLSRFLIEDMNDYFSTIDHDPS